MLNKDDTGVILKKVRSDGLVMSRVPKNTRDKFIKLSDDEFCGDRGMALKYLFDQFELMGFFLSSWDVKLDAIYNTIKNIDEKEDNVEINTDGKVRRMLNGNTIKEVQK